MSRGKDTGIAAAAGVLIALIMLGIAGNIGMDRAWIYPSILLFPALSALGMQAAFLLARRAPVFLQLARYVLVGALNTFVDLGVLNILLWATGIASGAWFSAFKGISFFVALMHSYAWNRLWTFRGQERKEVAGEFAAFSLVSLVAVAANVGVASFVVNVIPIPDGMSPNLWANLGAIAGTLVATAWNFVGYKFLVFVNP